MDFSKIAGAYSQADSTKQQRMLELLIQVLDPGGEKYPDQDRAKEIIQKHLAKLAPVEAVATGRPDTLTARPDTVAPASVARDSLMSGGAAPPGWERGGATLKGGKAVETSGSMNEEDAERQFQAMQLQQKYLSFPMERRIQAIQQDGQYSEEAKKAVLRRYGVDYQMKEKSE
jgi:hypothetical protein